MYAWLFSNKFVRNLMNFLRLKLWMIGRKQRVSPLSVIVLVTLFIILLFFIKMVQTGSAVGFAFALSIAAGMSTCIGGAIVFFKRLVQLASPRTLSVSLSLSAGVMIFISLVEIFGKSVESYEAGFQEVVVINDTLSCGELGFDFMSKSSDGKYHCANCDTTCQGHSWGTSRSRPSWRSLTLRKRTQFWMQTLMRSPNAIISRWRFT